MSDWYEDEVLWDELFEFMFPVSAFEAAVGQAERLKSLAGLETGDVLDMPCGPGRHALPLARLGFRVTGVDLTAPLLKRAQDAASEEMLDVEWVRSDMRSFRRPTAFDLAVNAFTSLGYFDKWADNVQVVQNVYDSLKPGGTFVVETLGKEGLAAIFLPSSVHDLGDGRLRVERRWVVDGWRRLENEWILIEGDRVIRRWRVDHWLYSAGELIDMFRGVGFVDIETYSGWTEHPYDHKARRLLVVGRK